MSDYLDTWLESEHTVKFPEIADDIRNHDRTCKSLDNVWLPHINGVSCPSDLASCRVCHVTFFNEAFADWDGNDRPICECCNRKG